MYEAEGMDVAVLESILDTQFIACAEEKYKDVKFRRVDADVPKALGDEEATEDEALCALFKSAIGNDKLTVKVQKLKNGDVPVMLAVPEEFRRMQDTMRMYQLASGKEADEELPADTALILNGNSALIGKLGALAATDEARAKQFALHLYRLSLLSLRKLNAEEMRQFLAESYRILTELA